MPQDPFDKFIEKMFRRMMSGGGELSGGAGYSVSVKKIGNETEVEVQGDVSEREIERLKRKYPDAEISVNGEKIGGPGSVEVVEEVESEEEKRPKQERRPKIEEVDEEEMEPEELALRRLEEKKREEE